VYSEEYDIIAIFMKLPSKKEYPDYYQIIRHPIALETIKVKKKSVRVSLLFIFPTVKNR
jgi:DNA-binding cell septation regulator SpoVG